MPIFGSQTQHHDSEDNEEIASKEHVSEVPKIEERSGQYPDKDEQPGLNSSDPADGRRRGAGKQLMLIVGLEGTV
jgi:hypothetical protein